MPSSIEEFVARENIKQFERQLAKAADEQERALLLKLLHEEKEKLAAAVSLPNPS